METSKKIQVLAVGDVFNDTFIALEEAKVTYDENHQNCTISMKFGDKIPYKSAILVRGVGNAGNAAVSAARLGLSSAIITCLGNDTDGQMILDHFKQEKVADTFIIKDPKLPTNSAFVLQYEAERTILVKQEDYPYEVSADLLNANKPEWIYLTSIGKTEAKFQHDLITWLTSNPEVKLVFQPGTFQFQLGKEELADVYRATHILFLNVEEGGKVLGVDTLGTDELLKRLHALGPKIVVMTDGPKGAYAFDGTDTWFVPPYPDPKPPFERTGAGDAFSSTTVAALALGNDLPTALSMGAINSMSVVQFVGAQEGLLSMEQIKKHLVEAPSDFKPRKL